MRAVVLGCLMATVVSTIAVTGATAQNTCSVNTNQVDDCAATYATAAPSDICGAMHSYAGCVGNLFSCNVTHFASEWATALAPYRSIWATHCTANKRTIPGIDATVESSLAYGDPHFRLNNGTFQSCNGSSSYYLAVSKYYTVQITNSATGTPPAGVTEVGTAISQVTINFYHMGAPTTTYNWFAGGGTPSAASVNGIVVSDEGVRADVLGLNLKITRNSNNLLLAGLTKKMNGGILINGCPANRANLTTGTVSGPCARLPADYRAACAYDAERISPTWAVAVATAAKAEEGIVNAWAYTQNGANGVALLSAAAVAISALVAMML